MEISTRAKLNNSIHTPLSNHTRNNQSNLMENEVEKRLRVYKNL